MQLLELGEIPTPLLGSKGVVLLFWVIVLVRRANSLSLRSSQLFALNLLLKQRCLFRCEKRSLQKLEARFS